MTIALYESVRRRGMEEAFFMGLTMSVLIDYLCRTRDPCGEKV
ncbi:MAG: hypothetical protein ACP5QG_05755 [candidate division WOR-3 bacterium]